MKVTLAINLFDAASQSLTQHHFALVSSSLAEILNLIGRRAAAVRQVYGLLFAFAYYHFFQRKITLLSRWRQRRQVSRVSYAIDPKFNLLTARITGRDINFFSGVLSVTDVLQPSIGRAPYESDFPAERQAPGIFARIISALHHSRRLQAHRVLRQYQHLIERHSPELISLESNRGSGGQEMPVIGRPDRAKRAAQPAAPAEMGWLVAVAVGHF